MDSIYAAPFVLTIHKLRYLHYQISISKIYNYILYNLQLIHQAILVLFLYISYKHIILNNIEYFLNLLVLLLAAINENEELLRDAFSLFFKFDHLLITYIFHKFFYFQ